MNVLIINHSQINCGVYQYGKRFGSILSTSKLNSYKYLELSTNTELLSSINLYKPKFIIYNYLEGTMPWVNAFTVSKIRDMGILQALIVHNINHATFFDLYLHQDPNYSQLDGNNYALKRPLFEYIPKVSKLDNEVVHIGSFGFGFKVKHFDKICRIVSKQFRKQKVQVNLHLTKSFFSPNDLVINEIETKCSKVLKNKLHTLKVTRHFMTDNEMLDFLAGNDLNIFLYEKYRQYNGISSTIDYAMSVEKPIAINNSNMFSHIRNVSPTILIEKTKLKEIIENGFGALEDLKRDWSHVNFKENVDTILSNYAN
jgi:hypothetical protein